MTFQPDDPFEAQARGMLKSQMASLNLSTEDLYDLLLKHGHKESRNALNLKINRGKFSLAFYLRCMDAMELDGTFVFLPSKRIGAQSVRKLNANAMREEAPRRKSLQNLRNARRKSRAAERAESEVTTE